MAPTRITTTHKRRAQTGLLRNSLKALPKPSACSSSQIRRSISSPAKLRTQVFHVCAGTLRNAGELVRRRGLLSNERSNARSTRALFSSSAKPPDRQQQQQQHLLKVCGKRNDVAAMAGLANGGATRAGHLVSIRPIGEELVQDGIQVDNLVPKVKENKRQKLMASKRQHEVGQSSRASTETIDWKIEERQTSAPLRASKRLQQQQRQQQQQEIMKKHWQQQNKELESDEMKMMRMKFKEIEMNWNDENNWQKCRVSLDKKIVHFHPECAEGTAVCMTNKPLKVTSQGNREYYWEIKILDKTYGTSVMFGLCTKRQPLYSANYCNLIGLDQEGWSMSHKGLIWHSGTNRPYANHFPTNQSVVVGLHYNTTTGELSYFLNGKNLGVAFIGLNEQGEDLYPCVGSTAKNTVAILLGAYCGPETLLDRCCLKILGLHQSICSIEHENMLDYLENNYKLPTNLVEHLRNLTSKYKQQQQRLIKLPQSVSDSWRRFSGETHNEPEVDPMQVQLFVQQYEQYFA